MLLRLGESELEELAKGTSSQFLSSFLVMKVLLIASRIRDCVKGSAELRMIAYCA